MKTKYWIILLALVLVLSLGLSFWLLRPKAPEKTVTVVQDGIVTQVLDLSENQILELTGSNGGTNTVEIRDGKVAVTHASCPDHVCMAMGWCDSGLPIACLPNGLILSFASDSGTDAAAARGRLSDFPAYVTTPHIACQPEILCGLQSEKRKTASDSGTDAAAG